MLPIQLRAIIFDYGNVLCSSPLPAEIEAMAAILKAPLDEFQQNYWRNRLQFDAAELDPSVYWTTVAHRPLTDCEIGELQQIDSESWAHADPIMPAWAGRVRAAGFRTGLLSNMPAPVRDHIIRCPWLPAFDHTTFSCDSAHHQTGARDLPALARRRGRPAV